MAFAGLGFAVTAGAGHQMSRWTEARDAERFSAECEHVVMLIEQKMERIETAFGRMRDACAATEGRPSQEEFVNWTGLILALRNNYPCVRIVACAPKVTPQERDAHLALACAEHGANYAPPPGGERNLIWLPAWRVWARDPGAGFAPGTDLGQAVRARPSLTPALGAVVGWVSDSPSPAGSGETGYWFTIPLGSKEISRQYQRQLQSIRGESPADSTKRIRAVRTGYDTGLLAVLISGDDFLREFNGDGGPRPVHVALYTSKSPRPDQLLNPSQPAPGRPRRTADHVMPWYGRRWTARFSSTPLFEAGSLRYRNWLVWGGGVLLSLAGAAVVLWQTRLRWREVALAARLRDVLADQEALSRDLHDGTLQSIHGVALGLERARRLLERRPAEARTQIEDSAQALQRVTAELREVIRQSDPGTREEVPLGQVLHGMAAHFRLASEIDVEIALDPGADTDLSQSQSLHLANIAREALGNSLRHGQARRIHVELRREPDGVLLVVQDDGRGFDVARAVGHQGRGLRNVAARVRELGGSHRWESTPGAGACLTVRVPRARAVGPPRRETP